MSHSPFDKPLPSAPAPGTNPFGDVNPYAAPQQPLAWQPAAIGSPSKFDGLWQQGSLLVMHKQAPLPDICLKSNVPATGRLKRSLQWHHPALILLIFVNLLVYVVVALILTKRATIQMPLSEEWLARRRTRLLIAWVWFLLSLGLCIGSVVLAAQLDRAEPLIGMAVGIFSGLAALIYGQYACSLVRPTRITDQYVWLIGVHPDFLKRLEVWQWNI